MLEWVYVCLHCAVNICFYLKENVPVVMPPTTESDTQPPTSMKIKMKPTIVNSQVTSISPWWY